MYERFTDRARKVMQLANQEARRFNHEYIGTEHVLLGLIKEGSGVAANVLKNLDIDLRKTRLEVEKLFQCGPLTDIKGKLPQTPSVKKIIGYSIEEARNLNHNYVGTEHLLLGLLREHEGVAAQVLMNLGLKLEDVREEVIAILGANAGGSDSGTASSSSVFEGDDSSGRAGARSVGGRTPTLDRLGLDLTELARKGKLAPIIGRKDELERVLMVLSCRTRRNPILVGDVGVGKSTLVSGLAQLSAQACGPLQGRRLVAVNLGRMVVRLQGQRALKPAFAEALGEIRRAETVLLYVDDLQTLVGRESRYIRTALKSALVRGEVQCITTATPRRYRSAVAIDAVLARHFEPVHVRPLSKAMTLEILRNLRRTYETHHRVTIHDDALEAAVELADLHLTHSGLPGKAIHLLDEAGALVRLRSAPSPPDFSDLDARIEQLTREKENAIRDQDFERAATCRDEADRIRNEKLQAERDWSRTAQQPIGTVDRETIAAVVRRMIDP